MASVNLTPLGKGSYHQVGHLNDGGLVSYTNNTGVTQQINSFTMYMGTGLGTFTAGDTVVGNGQSITLSFVCNDVVSNQQTTSTQVGPTGSPDTYPIRNSMTAITFTFSGLQVLNGQTVEFSTVNNGISLESGPGTCYVWDDGARAQYSDGHYATADVTPVGVTVDITYDGNGGMLYDSATSTSGTTISETTTSNISYTVSNTISASKSDGSGNFIGWSTNSSATTAQYNGGDTFIPTSNTTLYAIYSTNSYTVTFTDGYSGTVLKTETVSYGGNATPPSNPTRTGYNFIGWGGSYTNVTDNRTIPALWGNSGIPIWIYTNSGWVAYKPTDNS